VSLPRIESPLYGCGAFGDDGLIGKASAGRAPPRAFSGPAWGRKLPASVRLCSRLSCTIRAVNLQ
jgi:hypothetical protein